MQEQQLTTIVRVGGTDKVFLKSEFGGLKDWSIKFRGRIIEEKEIDVEKEGICYYIYILFLQFQDEQYKKAFDTMYDRYIDHSGGQGS